jgi:hypothetical protein
MLVALAAADVPIKPTKLNPAKAQAVTPALQALLSKDNELKVGEGGGSRRALWPSAQGSPLRGWRRQKREPFLDKSIRLGRAPLVPGPCAARDGLGFRV